MSEREIFVEAMQISDAQQRSEYLNQACAGDADLRARVQTLLDAHEQAGSFLEFPAPVAALTSASEAARGTADDRHAPSEQPGTVIGNYKLLEVLGEGGMGIVYLAEQIEPVRRKVALKIIKAGMDTRQVIARFEAERQALALMDHHHIARVIDAGSTHSGRSYFVMELVKGLPITEYCDQQRLTPKQRLQLFADVCEAIQHAHQKGIIHRDIKPSNILITMNDGRAAPKVIDFGIAKATGQPLTERTMFTEIGQVVGTPEYMSPEQAEVNQLDIDTRSDIYALGVLLYELLTGTTPITKEQLRQAGFDEMLRTIRESEPPKPSTRLSESADALPSISAVRRTEPSKLSRLIRGELDWIVMKALEKDRNRRYETASSLARDIQRFLTDRPVEACPPSAGYRFRKFARRNKTLLATAASFAVILLSATVVSGMMAAWALNERDIAHAERAEKHKALIAATHAATSERHAKDAAFQSQADMEAFAGFLMDDILAAARPESVHGGLGIDVSVRQALDLASANVTHRFAGRPRAEAKTRQALGITYVTLLELPKAIEHLELALQLYRQECGPDDIETLFTQNELARAYLRDGRLQQSLELHQQTLQQRKNALGIDHPHTLASGNNVAWCLLYLDEKQLAIQYFEETQKRMEELFGPLNSDTLTCTNGLASAYVQTGQPQRAIPLLETLLSVRHQRFGDRHESTLNSKNSLAAAYTQTGRAEEAVVMFQDVLEVSRELFVPQDVRIVGTMNNLAKAFHKAGDLENEEQTLLDLLTLRRANTAQHADSKTAETLADLGRNQLEQGKYAESVSFWREGWEIGQQKAPEHWQTARFESALGNSLTHLAVSLRSSETEKATETFAKAEQHLTSGLEGLLSREDEIPQEYRSLRVTNAFNWLIHFYESRAAEGDVQLADDCKARRDAWQDAFKQAEADR